MPRISKAYSPRSKTGCLTCRRIKCDETKPNCLKCSSTGRKCDGYENRISLVPSSHYRLPISRASPGITGSEREIRSFQFFYERTVPSLAGYCGSEFWSRLVLQVSQHEKPVWHAIVALGAKHETFERMPVLSFKHSVHDTFALKEYLMAIRALLGPMDRSSFDSSVQSANDTSGTLTVDVCLISCILFICFEILSSHYVAALNHIRSGIKILEGVYYDPDTGTYRHPFLNPSTASSLEIENLRKIFIRLHIQAWTLTRADVDDRSMDVIQSMGAFPTQVPQSFSSLTEARDVYEYFNYVMRGEYNKMISTATASQASDLYDFGQRCMSLFGEWSGALDRFERDRGPSLTTKERIGLKILQIHRCEQAMLLEQHASGMTDSNRWDRYNSIFQEITSLAASVVELSGESGSAPSTPLGQVKFKPNFSLDMGIIAPLYNTATLCRDPLIRRRAVDILRSASRQEGAINSYMWAIAAEKVIALEESVAAEVGLGYDGVAAAALDVSAGQRRQSITRCSEVPDNARFSYAYPKFDIASMEVSLTVEREMGGQMNIPLPAMTAMLDAEGR
ncbi:hypothetical protein BO70DRAFT_346232 [Aspergillus heteromorphus CBS 117.55]|uniref:Zn(2)-C6 fungal-type domain-containing protein n=1 Tax=Aspergillus heteromorphus CBS 117.55 TaxID=1448321 RepID=A0A317UWB9_9EURO|nr:uncharacterized protein BO70DRAFT_346232 [Aspergillus heteromorphus CBS 117.55]PWY65709.1 hypothetical protein BO70DRAFT_346232 [Aspergillus heteromorphus CBS 117.55]